MSSVTKKSSIILSISLEDIQSFITVAELNSFTDAAIALYTTQPQLSRKISAMESRIGVRLFDRSKRQIKLTPAGEQLFTILEPQVRRLEESFERIEQMYKERSNVLRICCDERLHAVDDFLLPLLLRFQQKNAKIDVEMDAYALPTLKNRLLQKETDVILSSFPEKPVPSKGIQWIELKRVQMCAAAKIDHQFAYRRSIDWAELQGELLLLRSPKTAYEYCNYILEECEKCGFSANTRTYANEASIILNLNYGSGVCIGSEYDFSKESKLIRMIPITGHYDYLYAGVREKRDYCELMFLKDLVENFK